MANPWTCAGCRASRVTPFTLVDGVHLCTACHIARLTAERDEATKRAEATATRLRKAEEVVTLARQLGQYAWEDRLDDSKTSDDAKHDARELSIAVFLYDNEFPKGGA